MPVAKASSQISPGDRDGSGAGRPEARLPEPRRHEHYQDDRQEDQPGAAGNALEARERVPGEQAREVLEEPAGGQRV